MLGQSVEHPFLVNHPAGLWENLGLGAGKGSGSWVLGWLTFEIAAVLPAPRQGQASLTLLETAQQVLLKQQVYSPGCCGEPASVLISWRSCAATPEPEP